METSDRELVRRLFAAATALLEEAHAATAKGQSQKLLARGYAVQAKHLRALAIDAASLANAAAAIAQRSGPENGH